MLFYLLFRSEGFRREVLKAVSLSRPRRNFSVKSPIDTSRLRNIGIIAHIDAGKTTTSERMLFYSGHSKFIGEVHHGDTIMDYMSLERERGITINSAAISFRWDGYKINLIDTPGHVDFTIEVERSLRVLDGAVTVIDASAGVEAQTVTVWRQADKYSVPRIAYLNKMDKPKASFDASLNSMRNKLRCNVLPIQIPVGQGKSFVGVVDLLTMEKVLWCDTIRTKGLEFKRTALTEKHDGNLWEQSQIAREALIDELSDLDDEIVECVLNEESMNKVSAEHLQDAIRRVTLSRTGIPVLCGSSYKNIGVQLLLKSILDFLPSPSDIQHNFLQAFSGKLCALAFKTIHHKQKGALTYFRLYSGQLKGGQKVYNVNKDCTEKIGRLFEVYADDYHEISSIDQGNIVVSSGLKEIYTGDTIVASHSEAEAARTFFKNEECDDVSDNACLAIVDVPEPVFFCTIEPASLLHQKPLEHALSCLQKEDPSFKVDVDDDSGQTIVSGMGELHIEVIKDRIRREFKVDCDLGPLNVAYKETAIEEQNLTNVLHRTLGDTKHHAEVTLSLHLNRGVGKLNKLKLFHSREVDLNNIRRDRMQAVEKGVQMALRSGPLLGYSVTDVNIGLHSFRTTYSTSMSMISSCASQCVTQMLKNSGTRLLEPIMFLELTTDKSKVHAILSDLSSRRGHIVELQPRDDVSVIMAQVPLSELIGYSTNLRIITSGMASFTMEFHHDELMNDHDQNNVISKARGFM